MKRTYLIFFIFLLSSFELMASESVCDFNIDKMYEAKSGKFNKGKIYSDEKNYKIKITNITKISDKTFSGTLNGANHIDRDVKMVSKERVVSISQSDANNPDYFAHYTIFANQKTANGDYLSSMYEVYPSNWGFGAVYYYRGSCKIIK